MNSLLKLHKCGQSYWLDDLSRKKITSGELKQRIEEEGLCGITSNPAIFNNSIAKSADYNDQLSTLLNSTKKPLELYEKLAIKDIQDACDILKPVYEDAKGQDGFVSLEVSPYLARNANGTMDEVRRFYKEVNRPNCLIKIPGTLEGIPAIEQMLYEGININITLLFSVKVYEMVAHAYIRALSRRVKANLPIDHIASVASFFLSRIDVMVDEILISRIAKGGNEGTKAKGLLGKIAVANAKMAYQSFKKIFSGSEWESLVAKGARVQRPLWASTSTKNPEYKDVMYVEPLIGPDTVNTMPGTTVEAFLDHGKVSPNTIEKNLDEAEADLAALASLGINLDTLTDKLVDEGIQKFIDPFNALLQSIEEKVAAKSK